MSEPGAPRFRRRLLLVPAALLAAAAVVPIDAGVERELWRAVGDALHAPLMAAAALLVLAALPRRWSTTRRVCVAASVAIAVAVAVEVGQPWVGRSASFVDAVNGALGAAAALGGWLAWTRGAATARAGHALFCVAVAIAVSMPAWGEWRSIHWRERNRPLLGDFEDAREERLWRPLGAARGTHVRRTAGPATSGTTALEILTAPGGWSGTSYHAGIDDWRGGRALAFDVMNLESRDVVLHVRIDDDDPNATYHSRFNDEITLEPGWTSIELPLERIRSAPRDRPLDLSRIRRLVLFVDPDAPPTRLRVDHVRIE